MELEEKPGMRSNLSKLVLHKSVYWFYPGNENDLNLKPWKGEKFKTQDYAWQVIRDTQSKFSNNKYELKFNDIIKLGRVRFRMKRLITKCKGKRDKNQELQGMDVSDFLPNYAGTSKENQAAKPEGTEFSCRICLDSDYDSMTNPLISPCKCAGTMKYIHIRCLQKWLQSKLVTKNNGNSIRLSWKTLECELCKHSYPRINPCIQFLISYQIISTSKTRSSTQSKYQPLMVRSWLWKHFQGKEIQSLEFSYLTCKSKHPSSLYLTFYSKQSHQGRGHQADIRLNDISVSRQHAIIHLEKGKFFLEDIGSKFGTLVLIQDGLPLCGVFSHSIIQIGRTLLKFFGKRNIKLKNAQKPDIDMLGIPKLTYQQSEYSGGDFNRLASNSFENPQGHEDEEDEEQEEEDDEEDEDDDIDLEDEEAEDQIELDEEMEILNNEPLDEEEDDDGVYLQQEQLLQIQQQIDAGANQEDILAQFNLQNNSEDENDNDNEEQQPDTQIVLPPQIQGMQRADTIAPSQMVANQVREQLNQIQEVQQEEQNVEELEEEQEQPQLLQVQEDLINDNQGNPQEEQPQQVESQVIQVQSHQVN